MRVLARNKRCTRGGANGVVVKLAKADALAGELILRTQPGDALVERRSKAGESVHIPAKLIHQIEAVKDSDVLEASTPELDDLVRLTDRYGRS